MKTSGNSFVEPEAAAGAPGSPAEFAARNPRWPAGATLALAVAFNAVFWSALTALAVVLLR